MALDFPANPTNGQVYDSYVYNSTVGAWQSREDSRTVAILSSTVPASANPGDIWVNTNDGISFVYYDDGTSAQWMELLPSGVPLLNTKADIAYVDSQDALKANISSPTFTGVVTAPRFTSTQATGTAPFTVSSTTVVANLNADLLDGQHASVYSPAGMVSQFAGSSAPTGWLLCDGTAVSRTTYATLFAAISTQYGAGDGSTTFNLPNLQGRVPAGKAASGTFSILGGTGGSEAVALDGNNLPAHTHTFSGTTSTDGSHSHTSGANSNGFVAHATGGGGYAVGFTNAGSGEMMFYRYTDAGGSHTHTYSGTTSSSGGGQPHTNLQPYIVMNYIIKT